MSESVRLGEILTSDFMSNIFLCFLTRSLLKETGTLESQLEANKVSNVEHQLRMLPELQGVPGKPGELLREPKGNPSSTFRYISGPEGQELKVLVPTLPAICILTID